MEIFTEKFGIELPPAPPGDGSDVRLYPSSAAIATDVYEAVSDERGETARLASNLVWQIENRLHRQGWPSGQLIGSESRLVEAFSVSREVIREAVRIGEAHGSLQMRRGRGGGMVACKPELAPVSRAIADYIFCSGATATQVRQACEVFEPLILAAVARRISKLGETSEDFHCESSNPIRRYFALRRFVLDRIDDPVLALFWDISTRLAMHFIDRARMLDPDSAECLSKQERAITQALLAGDAAQVETICARNIRDAWLLDLLSVRRRAPSTRDSDTSIFLNAPANRSDHIVRALLEEVYKRDCGDRLGSEWDICSFTGAARPIVRQALRKLEDHGLLESRRGRSGGIFTCKQKPGSIIRMVYPYLAANDVRGHQTLFMVWRMNLANVRLAGERALRFSQLERDHHLRTVRAKVATMPNAAKWIGVQQVISAIGENKVLDTLLRLLVGFAARAEAPGCIPRPAWDTQVRQACDVAGAILHGRVDLAETLQNRTQAVIEKLWIPGVAV